MKSFLIWLMVLGFAVVATADAYALELQTEKESPIKRGAVYDICVRFHKKEVLTACNYLCLYDRPCARKCMDTSEESVLNKECGTEPAQKLK
jgi:hypothetical protein